MEPVSQLFPIREEALDVLLQKFCLRLYLLITYRRMPWPKEAEYRVFETADARKINGDFIPSHVSRMLRTQTRVPC